MKKKETYFPGDAIRVKQKYINDPNKQFVLGGRVADYGSDAIIMEGLVGNNINVQFFGHSHTLVLDYNDIECTILSEHECITPDGTGHIILRDGPTNTTLVALNIGVKWETRSFNSEDVSIIQDITLMNKKNYNKKLLLLV